jgi:hypothetical protein
VNKNVLSLIGRDEAKALRIIEPLNCTGATHLLNLLFLVSVLLLGDSKASLLRSSLTVQATNVQDNMTFGT